VGSGGVGAGGVGGGGVGGGGVGSDRVGGGGVGLGVTDMTDMTVSCSSRAQKSSSSGTLFLRFLLSAAEPPIMRKKATISVLIRTMVSFGATRPWFCGPMLLLASFFSGDDAFLARKRFLIWR
jgi:hypothetical protein